MHSVAIHNGGDSGGEEIHNSTIFYLTQKTILSCKACFIELGIAIGQ